MAKTQTHDKQGNEWAKLSELKAGDKVRVDGGFTCLIEGDVYRVWENTHGLFIDCDEGQHYLSGQADNGDHLVGIYPVKP